MAGGYNRPYGTNVAFAQAGKSLAQRQIDMQQFREAYLQANGTLVGADTEWSKYRDANPILHTDWTPRKAQHCSDWSSSQMNRAIDRLHSLICSPPSVRKGSTPSRPGPLFYALLFHPLIFPPPSPSPTSSSLL